ncbi:LysM peptidoglycan-binding domain-containing protein, partial [Enterococcus silesiacus]
MKKYVISRKERRKAEQNKLAYDQLKKGTTMLSSALVVSSIAAPIAAPKIAEAAEDQSSSAQVSYSDTMTHTEAVQAETTTDSNDSMTQETQTTAPETSSSEATSETVESSELNTSETTQSTEATESTEKSTETTDSSTTETETEESTEPNLMMRSAFAQSRSISPSTFIAEIAGHARSVAAANDLYASVMMAQAILESDWGRSTLAAAPNHNLFGIKGSYQGQSVTMKTWEVINGQWVQVNAAFRKYPSYSESFSNNAAVLKTTSFQAGVYYYSGAWKSNTNSYKDATAWLTGRYATDPGYNTKLNNIITTYNLTQYDTPSSGGGNTGGTTPGGGSTGENTGNNNNTGGGTSSQNVTHTVKAGDSLWALSAKYGISIATIKSWNNLSSDVIYVGQKLVVKKESGNSGSTGGSNSGGNTGGSGNTGNTGTSSTYYTVKSGDSLWAIANANGISITNLRQWNSLSGDIIYPGQKLIVKKGSGNTGGGNTSGNTGGSTGNSGGSSNAGASSTYYTVKSGDSLWAIANANGISIANLRQWNSLNGDIIYPGQKLVVKKGSGSTGGNTNSG